MEEGGPECRGLCFFSFWRRAIDDHGDTGEKVCTSDDSPHDYVALRHKVK